MSRALLKVQKNTTILELPIKSFFAASKPKPTPSPQQQHRRQTSTMTTKPSKAPPIIVTRTSTCLCKSVKVEFTGQDKDAVLCHCSNCRQASGSAFMHNHRLVKSHITVLKGGNLLRSYKDSDTKSGNVLNRHFCGNCGSSLYLTNDAVKGFVAMAVGNLEGEKRQPFMELFPENKSSWIGSVIDKAKL